MPKQHEGGCHCGEVRYSFTKEPELTFYCYCRDCQKTTGSPFSMELMIEQSSFEIDGALNPDVFVAAWKKTIARHDILRTTVHWEKIDKPLQVVHAEKKAIWEFWQNHGLNYSLNKLMYYDPTFDRKKVR